MLREKFADESEEDVSFLAGWMYADLFLAMMVVFLATITFIPEYIGKMDQSSASSAYNYKDIYKKPLVVVYDGFNADSINNDIRAFLSSEKLSTSSDVIYAQIVGAYDPNSETASDAIIRAQNFSRKLDIANIDSFKNVSTTLSSTTSISSNRIVLKLTFATNIGVKLNP